MNIKKTLAGTALAIGLVALPVAAQEQGTPRLHGKRQAFSGRMLRHAGAALQLTEAQKEFAKQLAADTRRQVQPLAADLRQNRETLQAAVKANNTAEIRRISQRQGDLMGELAAIRSESMAKFYAQLTPEQKVKAAEMREQFKNRVKQFREKRNERRNG